MPEERQLKRKMTTNFFLRNYNCMYNLLEALIYILYLLGRIKVLFSNPALQTKI